MTNQSSKLIQSSFPAKAAVIIDGGYWRKVLEELGFESVDLISFTDQLCQPAYRIRTYFFDGKIQETQSFHDSLQLLDRFEVSLGEVVPRDLYCPKCNGTIKVTTQKRVDVALAVELVHLATAGHVDLIVLIAGDRDFIPAIQTAKHAGVILRLVHGHPQTVSDTLLKLVDEKIELSMKYFQKNKIPFTKMKIEEIIPKITRAQKAEEEKQIQQMITKVINDVESILIRLLTKSSEEYVSLSQIGIELNKIAPEWKKESQIKLLSDLVQLDESKFIIKKINKHYYLSSSRKREKPAEKETNSFEQFILTTITEHFETNKTSTIPLVTLGHLLTKKNPNWKKYYHTKQLKAALIALEENILVSGKGTKIIVKLKKRSN